jgi:DNA-binding NarL/FixJ family response regulator
MGSRCAARGRRVDHGAIALGRPVRAGEGDAVIPPTLLIADDDRFIQSVLVTQLGRQFAVVGVAGDAAEAIALAQAHRPDLAIVDVEMPEGGGLRATREIRATVPGTAVVILSAQEPGAAVRAIAAAGAVAFVRKGTPGYAIAEVLYRALRAHDGWSGAA